MSVKNLVNTLLSIDVPNLNTKKYGDVYDILNNESINYCAMVLELLRTSEDDTAHYTTLRITVVDRLNNDETNLLDVFDNTEHILHDVLKKSPEYVDYEQNITVEYIRQDFADKLAGCYAEITFIDGRYHCTYYGN